MAYPYYPNYSNWGTPQMPVQGSQIPSVSSPTPQMANDINWVQGESDAKSRPVAAGHSVVFLDTEESVMYIKSVDASGMPQPLRVFEYTERKAPPKNEAVAMKQMTAEVVSRQEFDELKNEVRKLSENLHSPTVEEGEG